MADAHKIDIDYVAHLARLDLTQAERERFSAQLDSIIAYVEKLNEVDVSGLEAATHAFEHCNVWEEDAPGPVLAPETALRNAPEQRDNMIVVPQVVE